MKFYKDWTIPAPIDLGASIICWEQTGKAKSMFKLPGIAGDKTLLARGVFLPLANK